MRWLLLLLILASLLLPLFLSRCSGSVGDNEKAEQTVAHHSAITIENMGATFNAKEVNLSFDVVLTPASTRLATIDYQIEHTETGISGDREPALAGKITISHGEKRKTIHLTFNAQAADEFSLALIGSSGDIAFGDEKIYRVVPVDITPKTVQAPPQRPLVSYTVTVTASPAASGDVSGGGSYVSGSSATISAVPASGKEFVHWSDNGVVVSNMAQLTIRVTHDFRLTALFRPTPLLVTIADASLLEGKQGSSNLTFTANLSSKAESDITVSYATRNGTASGGASCSSGMDFIATRGTLTIPRGSQQASFDVPICGDSEVENDETFAVVFSHISANALLANMTATGTLSNDDALPGTAGNVHPIDLPPPDSAKPASPPDAHMPVISAESHSLSRYLKLDATGKPLTDQTANYAKSPWSCVLDRTTGLIWEVKSDDGGLHDKDWTYSWYNTNPATNGGDGGTAGKGYCEHSVPAGCDTEKFVAAVNAAGLCGANDWRLPTQEELQSIADLTRVNPSLERTVFPNTLPSWYWSSTPVAPDKNHAWVIGFYYGYDVWGHKSNDFYARLVRTAR